MHFDYVTYIIIALFIVIGGGLFRVGLMSLKSRPLGVTRKAKSFIALGIALGIAALLILALRVVKIRG